MVQVPYIELMGLSQLNEFLASLSCRNYLVFQVDEHSSTPKINNPSDFRQKYAELILKMRIIMRIYNAVSLRSSMAL